MNTFHVHASMMQHHIIQAMNLMPHLYTLYLTVSSCSFHPISISLNLDMLHTHTYTHTKFTFRCYDRLTQKWHLFHELTFIITLISKIWHNFMALNIHVRVDITSAPFNAKIAFQRQFVMLLLNRMRVKDSEYEQITAY